MPLNDVYEGNPLDAFLQAIEERDKDEFTSVDDFLKAIEKRKPPVSPQYQPYEEAKTFITETAPSVLKEAFLKLGQFTRIGGPVDPATYIRQAPDALGSAWTWAVRFLPGNEDLPSWEKQTERQKAWTGAQAASMIGAITEAIRIGTSIPGAIRDYARIHRAAKAPPKTKLQYTVELGKKAEPIIVKKEIVPLKPAVGAPSPERIWQEFTNRIVAQKIVKRFPFKNALQDYIYRVLNAQTPSRILDQAVQDAANRMASHTLRHVPVEFNPTFAKSLFARGSILDKMIPIAAEQLKAYGHISPTLFGEKAISAEERIVQREMPRPLTRTPEEYAEPTVAQEADALKLIDSELALMKQEVLEGEPGRRIKTPTGEWMAQPSTYPSWMREAGLDRKTALRAYEKKEGKIWDILKTIAQDRIEYGYESPLYGRVPPLLKYAEERAAEVVEPGGIESIGLSIKEIRKGDFPTFIAPDVADQMRYGQTEQSFLSRVKEDLIKVKDVLGSSFYRNYALRFKLNKQEVDMMFRNFFSTGELREKDTKKWLEHTFGTIDAKDAIALSLHQEMPQKYPIPDRLKAVAEKQVAVYEYWDKVLQSYGVYKEPFPLSMIKRTHNEIQKLKEEIGYLKQPRAIQRRVDKIEQLEELIGLLKTVRYLPHRYVATIENLIIEESADKDVTRLIPRRYSNVLRATFKEIRKRKIPTLEEATKLGYVPQLDARTIMGNYLLYVQREIAKADLARKLIKDPDLVLPEAQAPADWQKVAMRAFKGYKVHPALVDAIDEIAGARGKEWEFIHWWRLLTKTGKLLKFYIPSIMVVNNLQQSYLVAGVRAAIDPTIWGWSIKQLAGNTPTYKRFIERDLFPTPIDVRPSRQTQEEMIMMWVRHMDKNYPKVARALERASNGAWNFKGKTPVQALGRTVKGLYAMIWNVTWTLDRIQRMNSVKRLMDKGMSLEEAVERARFFHVDYGDLPSQGRRVLNMIFLTPTYRTGMAKVYGTMFRHPVKYKGPLARWIAAQFGIALGALLTGYTWKEYYRLTKKTEDELEERVITIPGPLAELQKYLGRGPTGSFYIYSSVPVHIAQSLIRNRDWKGDPICYEAESKAEQAADRADYVMRTYFAPVEGMAMLTDAEQDLRDRLMRYLSVSRYKRKAPEYWQRYGVDQIRKEIRQLLMDKYPEGAPPELIDELIKRGEARAGRIIKEKPGLLDVGAQMQRGLLWGLEKVIP